MAAKWFTAAPGIRCREHESRKHGVKSDRYYTLRYSVEGRQVEEALGWASEGWTLEKAKDKLADLRLAKRAGEPATLRAQAEAARALAEEERRQRQAKDEHEEQVRRQEKTVSELWDRYAKEVIAVENKGRTVIDKYRIWTKRLQPAIGHLKIKNVTEADMVAQVHAPFRLDKSGQVIGGKAEAGNIYRLLHHLFVKALLWGLRPKDLGNPLENIKEPKVTRRERLLTGGEIGALVQALDAASMDGGEHPQVIGVIRAAILTGARISELLTLQWDFVRREDMELHLPDTKTGFSRRPMSSATLAVLDSVGRMPGVPWVFRGIEDPRKPLDYYYVSKAFRRICAAAGVADASPHNLRHWFATMTANSVSNPRVGMALTGHKSHAAYMTYIHGDKDQARALADQLADLANGLGKAEATVTKLPKLRETSQS